MGEREAAWRPGILDRVRAFIRRAILTIVGRGGERRIHVWYHRLLRRAGRFGPAEDLVAIDLLGAVAARSQTIIDVGANVGRYSWFFRRHAGPQATLLALEPHPGAARLLREAIRGLPGCTVLELAAADQDGSAELQVPGGSFGEPVPALGWIGNLLEEHATHGIEVPMRRLDSLVDDGTVKVNAPVFIKIDVEGSEGRLLRGAAELIRRYRPVLYFECQAASLARQGQTPEVVWDYLERAGYRIFARHDGHFVRVRAVRAEVPNYLGVPDVGGADANQREANEQLDEAAMTSILDAWVARSTQG